jgi:putative ABC transport system permease protein
MGRALYVQRSDDKSGSQLTSRIIGGDFYFINVYGIQLLAGRNFSPADYNPDYNKLHNVLLNASAVKLFGFSSKEDAIGKSVTMFNKKWDVIGVVNDYHQKSLRYPMEPTIFQPFYGTDNPISVKVSSENLTAAIAAVKAKYAAFFPGNLFDYYFLDEKFNEQYKNDELFGKAFSIFAGFAIFIACLGLLGLSLFATTQRTKEIGVRKVVGASVSNIVFLLSKDFIKLVLIAFVIASPVAWFVMHAWLQDFAYRVNIGYWVFIIAGLLAIVIALATISFQAIKAAIANPVKSLRTE